MIEYQVNVDDGKQDETPHQDMMNLSYMHIPSKEWNNPGKQFGQECIAHGCIHAKPREALQQEYQECDKVDETCQRIMADRIDLFIRQLEDVDFDNLQHLLPLAAFQGNKIIPA
jgi:hypothetical protein